MTGTVACALIFVLAELLLIWGVLRRKPFSFLGSFPALVMAAITALVSEGSSSVFGLIGGGFIVFGLTCILLGDETHDCRFLSRRGLKSIGALLFFLGFAGLFML